ncbi:hypothetical protein NEISICOT_02972 [Neisseria sicca ATCC 29256]|uniref:Uncharacterized protein n=1 Tax=Neisseria sicca ATCC 29256 TaxID=547045 RepID=C6M8U7_NEISI|nr:hypothetical protein NEISICOT_02972 [Neisseria sicca ATCC 29256]
MIQTTFVIKRAWRYLSDIGGRFVQQNEHNVGRGNGCLAL